MAEPVRGPVDSMSGGKKRDTKSRPGWLAAAVTMMPLVSIDAKCNGCDDDVFLHLQNHHVKYGARVIAAILIPSPAMRAVLTGASVAVAGKFNSSSHLWRTRKLAAQRLKPVVGSCPKCCCNAAVASVACPQSATRLSV